MATQLPPPPHVNLQHSEEKRHAVVRLLNGSRVAGSFVDIDAASQQVSIEANPNSKPQQLAFSDIKVVYVDDPRHWHLPFETIGESSPIPIDPGLTTFKVIFIDDDTISGRTLGFRKDNMGLYLYPLRSRDRVTQCFIPASAISSYQFGKKIGEELVGDGIINQSAIDEALEGQKQKRAEKLGEVLGQHTIVTATELEKALSNQNQTPDLKIGEILLRDGLVTEEQLTESLELQSEGRRQPLGELLIAMGALSEEELHAALARKLGIPRVELKRFVVDKAAFDTVPVSLMARYHVVPLYQFDGRLVVAMSDPLNAEALHNLKFAANCHIDPVLGDSREIERLISLSTAANHVDIEALEGELDIDLVTAAASTEVMTYNNSLVVRLVNKILLGATYENASDIHLEPRARPGQTTVRQRIDGRLRDALHFPSRLHRAVIARLKVMAGMDVTETRRPQDGQINLKKFGMGDKIVRVATMPTREKSEDAVLRLVGGAVSLSINGLGLARDNESRLVSILESSNGLILAAGPTGSGKSTTLHSLLAQLNNPEKKIWTVEDPVEIIQPGLRQVQISPEHGLDFDSVLRSFLRLDPDVIMVGEIRDQDTAKVCVSAALTGHLVLSTLHTNGAAESVGRLLDMGVDAFDFADSLLATIAQRLARKVCSACKQTHSPSEEEMRELVLDWGHETDQRKSEEEVRSYLSSGKAGFNPVVLADARGCKECHKTGYVGLMAVHELLVNSKAISTMIHDSAATTDIRSQAMAEGMTTLRQDGIIKVLGGLTTLQEVRGTLGPASYL